MARGGTLHEHRYGPAIDVLARGRVVPIEIEGAMEVLGFVLLVLISVAVLGAEFYLGGRRSRRDHSPGGRR